MSYRSKDVTVMSDIQNSIYRLSNGEVDEASCSWELIRRYIVLDDLRKFLDQAYLKNEISYVPEYIPNLNLVDVEYMFVTLTETKEELEVFNAFLKTTGITNYFRTSYTKSSSKKISFVSALNSVLTSEIKTVKPKKLMIFDASITKQLGFANASRQIIDCFNTSCMSTLSIVRMLTDDPGKANLYKSNMWYDFLKLRDYVVGE